MSKEQSQLKEAVGRFNELVNARLRFFIGAAIKDALVLGNRTELLAEHEAQDLFGIVESDILTKARDDERVREFLTGNKQPIPSETGENEELHDPDECNMTPKEYYDIFIKPALDIIKEEYAERIGNMFVKYICTGEKPADYTLTDDEKILWNVFLMMVQIKFNPDFSAFISDVEL